MFSNVDNPKKPHPYYCEKCEFITSNKKDFLRHTVTQKHLNNDNQSVSIEKTQNKPKTQDFDCICGKKYKDNSGFWRHKKKCNLDTSIINNDDTDIPFKNKKNATEFVCSICDYNTSNKFDFNKHVNTIKHKNTDLSMNVLQKTHKKGFTCKKCDKKYNDYSGLWRHNKKCNASTENGKLNLNNVIEVAKDNPDQEKLLLSNLILEVVKQNKDLMKENSEFKCLMLEQHKMMLELAKNAGNNTNTHN